MNYRPYLAEYSWYVAKFDASGNRVPMSGMSMSFVWQYEALEYANDINRANGYPLARLAYPGQL